MSETSLRRHRRLIGAAVLVTLAVVVVWRVGLTVDASSDVALDGSSVVSPSEDGQIEGSANQAGHIHDLSVDSLDPSAASLDPQKSTLQQDPTLKVADAIAALLSLVHQDGSSRGFTQVHESLLAAGRDAVPDLLGILQNPLAPPLARRMAADVLARIAGESSIAALAAIVLDGSENDDVRQAALLALSLIDDDEARNAIRGVLDMERSGRLANLGLAIMAENATEDLPEILYRALLTKDNSTRQAAVAYLGDMMESKDTTTKVRVEQYIETAALLALDELKALRETAGPGVQSAAADPAFRSFVRQTVMALSELSSHNAALAVGMIYAYAVDAGDTQLAARSLFALSSFSDESFATGMMVQALNGSNPRLRMSAARALLSQDAESHWSLVEYAATREPHDLARSDMERALRTTPVAADHKALDPDLSLALGDSNPRVRVSAAWTLLSQDLHANRSLVEQAIAQERVEVVRGDMQRALLTALELETQGLIPAKTEEEAEQGGES